MPHCFYCSFSESKCKQYAAAVETKSARLEIGGKARDISFAESMLTGGLFDEARQELESVLTKDKQNVSALIMLSKIFIQQKNKKRLSSFFTLRTYWAGEEKEMKSNMEQMNFITILQLQSP